MKKLFAVLAGLFICAMAFAYDGTLVGGVDGSFSRAEWQEAAKDPTVAKRIVEENFEEFDFKMNKFFQVTDDNADEEDLEVVEDLEDYIDEEYGITNKAGYSHMIFRSVTDETVDGWVILTHYTKSSGFLHYVYYFSVSAE